MTEYVFVQLGEGRQGDYDPTDPGDVELLRLDAVEDGEETDSACTNLPTSISKDQETQALALVREFAAAHPELPPRKLMGIFSWMDETWLEPGQSGADDLLTAITYPKVSRFWVATDSGTWGPIEHLRIVTAADAETLEAMTDNERSDFGLATGETL